MHPNTLNTGYHIITEVKRAQQSWTILKTPSPNPSMPPTADPSPFCNPLNTTGQQHEEPIPHGKSTPGPCALPTHIEGGNCSPTKSASSDYSAPCMPPSLTESSNSTGLSIPDLPMSATCCLTTTKPSIISTPTSSIHQHHPGNSSTSPGPACRDQNQVRLAIGSPRNDTPHALANMFILLDLWQ